MNKTFEYESEQTNLTLQYNNFKYSTVQYIIESRLHLINKERNIKRSVRRFSH